MSAAPEESHSKLDAFSATAIAGNDILSSCLYVCGITALFAGVYAPLIFLLVVIVLALYRRVYTEVVEALPLNGGAYNCLLNATSKPLAAVAGVMTTLSYVATAVISAKTAVEYVHTQWHGLPVMPATIGVIVVFMGLTMLGMKDSARVAKGIFAFHLFSLALFISLGLMTIFNQGPGWLWANMVSTDALFAREGAWKMIFFAFSASLLGVSGFESSANFVEEQQPGVFRQTLRNLLMGVLAFNPLISLVVLSSLPLNQVILAKDFLLAESAVAIGGRALQLLIVTDAFFVLSGAVLASFVGATGLLYRMAIDHCLPSSILLPKLRKRNQNTNRIVLAFGGLAISILLMTGGNLLSLAGVYTISFLGVMTAFALGNVILRQTRPDLKRPYQGPLVYAVIAALATALGIVGNIMIDSQNLLYFALYFLPAFFIVMTMIFRDYILEALLRATKKRVPFLYRILEPAFDHVIKPRIILFAHHPEKLYDSLQYIRKNETSRNITIVFCSQTPKAKELIPKFKEFLQFFKEANIFDLFHMELVIEPDLEFGPAAVKTYANRYHITRNNVFIGSVHKEHAFSFEELGGVRIIQ